MYRQHHPSRVVPLPTPMDEPGDRPFLLLEDLVTDPIPFTLSDFGDLPDDLRGSPPPMH